jgi:hypothetical protein
MPRYIVSIDKVRREVSAHSDVDAASIFMGKEASATPRRAGDEPACYVKRLLGFPRRTAATSIPLWRMPDAVRD